MSRYFKEQSRLYHLTWWFLAFPVIFGILSMFLLRIVVGQNRSLTAEKEERRKVQEALQQREQLLITFLEGLPAAACCVEAVDRHIGSTLIGTGIKGSFKHRGIKGTIFSPTVGLVVFRVIQEALTNVIRHSKSDSVNIRLMFDGNYLSLRVRDYGVGFDEKAIAKRTDRMGLPGMEERAQMVGGVVRLISRPGKVTLVSLSFPVNIEEIKDDKSINN